MSSTSGSQPPVAQEDSSAVTAQHAQRTQQDRERQMLERDARQASRVQQRLMQLDKRHTRDLHEYIPEDAGQYADDIFDIFSRMDTGYWPAASISKGWYPLLAELNRDMRDVTDNFNIIGLKRENGALWLSIRVSAQDGHFLPALTSLMQAAKARSRCICEECGEFGDEVFFEHQERVFCRNHMRHDT